MNNKIKGFIFFSSQFITHPDQALEARVGEGGLEGFRMKGDIRMPMAIHADVYLKLSNIIKYLSTKLVNKN